MITLAQLREDASHYCEACVFRAESTPADVLCEHVGDNGGEARRIIYSAGKCPIGNWNHSKPIVFTPAAKRVEPIPKERWPSAVSEWAARRDPADKGIGDTLRRIWTAEAKTLLILLTPNERCSQRARLANGLYLY